MSFTLSDIQANFSSGGAGHVKASASPYLEFEFGAPPVIYKSTMVKHGGPIVAWRQPVLLTGANANNLKVSVAIPERRTRRLIVRGGC